ncbi:MAG TPA: DUF3619 family protein [Noviherbaspirillum sp.]|uniref:DUF3619 family protein n=1 Tax=Noviherbaspirillum sp. TaxID=1926288 RepID=UPI002D6800DB|nr:DUF3619 family protein [Noviherbaspirillum sp.]HYD96077.1 DUF3619 family protein [Noviherbaspirillum sp.]
MSTRELNFAYKVRHALNENLDKLPASTTEKLASARKLALSRRKKESRLRVFAARHAVAGEAGSFFNEPFSWLARMGLLVPLIVLIVGLTSIYQFEQQRRIDDTAETDAAVLADELPLSAYLDHGFNAYLASRDE